MTDGLRLDRGQTRARPHSPEHQEPDRADAGAEIQVSRDSGRHLECVRGGEHVVHRMTMTARALKDEPLPRQTIQRDTFAKLALEIGWLRALSSSRRIALIECSWLHVSTAR